MASVTSEQSSSAIPSPAAPASAPPESLRSLEAAFRIPDPEYLAERFHRYVTERIDRSQWHSDPDPMTEAFQLALQKAPDTIYSGFTPERRRQLMARTRNWMAGCMKKRRKEGLTPALKFILRLPATAEDITSSKLTAVLQILAKDGPSDPWAKLAKEISAKFGISKAETAPTAKPSKPLDRSNDAEMDKADKLKQQSTPRQGSMFNLAAHKRKAVDAKPVQDPLKVDKPPVKATVKEPAPKEAKLFSKETPSEKPVDRAVEQPANKPTEKSAGPSEKPVEKPAAPKYVTLSDLRSQIGSHKRPRRAVSPVQTTPAPGPPAKKAKTKRVIWAEGEDLVKVRYFETDVDNAHMRSATSARMSDHDEAVKTIRPDSMMDWHPPAQSMVDEARMGPLIAQMGQARGGRAVVAEAPPGLADTSVLDLSDHSVVTSSPLEPALLDQEAAPVHAPFQMPAFKGEPAPASARLPPTAPMMPMMPMMPGMYPMMPDMMYFGGPKRN